MIKIKFHRVPLYDLRLWVGVADDTIKLRAKFDWAFGPDHEPEHFSGMVQRHRSKFAVMFNRKVLCHALIAHEVFHATHRMLEFVEDRFNPTNPEPHAYLAGYLTQLVYVDLATWKIAVPTKEKPEPMRFVRP